MQDDHSFENILMTARCEAEMAVEKMGPENMYALDCGFAWVTIHGNEPLARYCRRQAKATGKRFYGHKGYPSGWQFWNPGNFAGQAIGHKEAGAKAFRQVLADYNIRADVGSRYD